MEDTREVYYRHFQDLGRTYAIEGVSRTDLIHAVNCLKKGIPWAMSLGMGIARLHPKDHFCKKLGRETAAVNMATSPAYLKSVLITERGTFYQLETVNDLVVFYRTHGHKYAKLERVCPDYLS